MHLYIDSIPKMVEFMKAKIFDDERVIEDAWWTLIFRAMRSHRPHFTAEDNFHCYGRRAVRSTVYGSKMPVYMA